MQPRSRRRLSDSSGVTVTKLIGYARVSIRQQSSDRQVTDLLGAGVRRDDLYIDPESWCSREEA